MFLKELGLWGIQLDSTLRLYPGEAKPNPYLSFHPTYHELYLDIQAGEIEKVADAMALGRDTNPLKTILQRGAQEQKRVPLTSLLPPSITNYLGTYDSEPCYQAAFQVRESMRWHPATFRNYVNTHYSTIGAGDTLKFGDVLMFWAPRGPQKQMNTLHAAFYLGGDFIYHKMGPDSKIAYEFFTLEGLYDYLTIQSQKFQGVYFWGDQAFLEVLRWDPAKILPSARSPQNPTPNLLMLSPTALRVTQTQTALLFPTMERQGGRIERPATPLKPSNKLGRNDPCWCGSGKKYKNCHLK